SLRRAHQLTSVAFGATAGPRKEGALVCSKGVQVLHRTCKPAASWRFYCTSKRFPFGGWPINLGLAQQSSAGLLPLEKGDYLTAAKS
uniref:hypothetical protein n=1 Tax=uncultured Dialister sp. TaxID=278064 RepID=UPI0025E7E179